MKSLVKLALLSLAITALPSHLQAQNEQPEETVYAFGYSTNLNDTTLYLSAIQPLEGAKLTPKDGFLEHRNEYGNQFKHYLEQINSGHHTCAVFFSKNKRSLEKKYGKLRSHLQQIKHTHLTELTSNEFQFRRLVIE